MDLLNEPVTRADAQRLQSQIVATAAAKAPKWESPLEAAKRWAKERFGGKSESAKTLSNEELEDRLEDRLNALGAVGTGGRRGFRTDTAWRKAALSMEAKIFELEQQLAAKSAKPSAIVAIGKPSKAPAPASKTPLLDKMNSLHGGERTRFWREHRKQISAEARSLHPGT